MDYSQYYNFIKVWHTKAMEEDYFSKYTFEYMAFIAFIKTQLYPNLSTHDRKYIQKLKRDIILRDLWINEVGQNPEAQSDINNLKSMLESLSFNADNRWWNNESDNANNSADLSENSLLQGIRDLPNVIEFWYMVRNNLFHGKKSPEIEEDKLLVKHAFKTMAFFMEHILLKRHEINEYIPAIWDGFFQKFVRGEAEVQRARDKAAATIYEIVLLSEDNEFPIYLDKKTFSRDELYNEACAGIMATVDGKELVQQKEKYVKSFVLNNKGGKKRYNAYFDPYFKELKKLFT
jgi:hypothetical protein